MIVYIILTTYSLLFISNAQYPCCLTFECDSDLGPSGDYTCEQQASWGKCTESWMIGYCCISCGNTCVDECSTPSPTEFDCYKDVAPDSTYTCIQQESWGKCSESFMLGYCCVSCPEACIYVCETTTVQPVTTSNNLSSSEYNISTTTNIYTTDTYDCFEDIPPGDYSCTDEKQWGKCTQLFMDGYCCLSCGADTCPLCLNYTVSVVNTVIDVKHNCEEDIPPDDNWSCFEQEEFNKCHEDWMVGYCCISCPDACLDMCVGEPTEKIYNNCEKDMSPGEHSCEDENEWNKCDEDWMEGYCCLSCINSCPKCNITEYINYEYKNSYGLQEDFVILESILIFFLLLIIPCFIVNKYILSDFESNKFENGSTVTNVFNVLIFIYLVLALIRIMANLLSILTWDKYIFVEHDNDDNILEYIIPLDYLKAYAYIFSKTIMYSLYLLRLVIAFKNSTYSYSKAYILTLSIILFINLVFNIIVQTIIVETLSKSDSETKGVSGLISVLLNILIFEEVVVSIILIISFIKPIYNLFKACDIDFGKQDNRLLDLISKYATLGIISVLSSAIASIMAVIWANNTQEFNGLFGSFMVSLDCVINGWCMLLMLTIFKNVYIKLCCLCDQCFHQIFAIILSSNMHMGQLVSMTVLESTTDGNKYAADSTSVTTAVTTTVSTKTTKGKE